MSNSLILPAFPGSKLGTAVARKSAYKEPVRGASIINENIAQVKAGDTIGGLVAAAGERFLFAMQGGGAANPANGIYLIGALAGETVRAPDMVSGSQVRGGMQVYVLEGDNLGTWRLITTTDPIILGVTPLEFVSAVATLAGTLIVVGSARQVGSINTTSAMFANFLVLNHDFDLSKTYVAFFSVDVGLFNTADIALIQADLSNGVGVSPAPPTGWRQGGFSQIRSPTGAIAIRESWAWSERFTMTGMGPSNRDIELNFARLAGGTNFVNFGNGHILLCEEA